MSVMRPSHSGDIIQTVSVFIISLLVVLCLTTSHLFHWLFKIVDPHKENQDAYNIIPSKFASGEGDAFFAVFDGHGDAGDKCAIFAKNKLPAYLAQNIKKRRAALNAEKLKNRQSTDPLPKNAFHPSSWPHLSEAGKIGVWKTLVSYVSLSRMLTHRHTFYFPKEYEEASRKAHLQCNKAMNDDKQVRNDDDATLFVAK